MPDASCHIFRIFLLRAAFVWPFRVICSSGKAENTVLGCCLLRTVESGLFLSRRLGARHLSQHPRPPIPDPDPCTGLENAWKNPLQSDDSVLGMIYNPFIFPTPWHLPARRKTNSDNHWCHRKSVTEVSGDCNTKVCGFQKFDTKYTYYIFRLLLCTIGVSPEVSRD